MSKEPVPVRANAVATSNPGRMRRWLRRIGVGVVGLVLLAIAALFIGAQMGERKMQRQVKVDVTAVALRADPAGLERGRYLFLSRGCTECHGVNGGGKVVVDDGSGMVIKSPNITPGTGNVVGKYTTDDWTRIIRHGVKPDGRPAIVMPSEDYNRFTDDDLGALVAYLRQMPPAEGGAAVVEFPMLVKALYAAGVIHDAAEKIDHSLPPSTPTPEGISAKHGAYVANACIGCHGAGLTGGKIPGAPPDWPPAADLRPGAGPMKAYSDVGAFARMLKTGKRPDNTSVSRVMPFVALQELNATDVEALFLYLRSLPDAG